MRHARNADDLLEVLGDELRSVVGNDSRFNTAKQYVEAWDRSRAALVSGGLLKYTDNLLIVREAKEMLATALLAVNEVGFQENCWVFKRLYGQTQDGGTPYGLGLEYELLAKIARELEQRGAKSEDAEPKQFLVELITEAMRSNLTHLIELEKSLETADRQRIEHKSSAAIIPGQEASERLLRYETHFSREIDRILIQLERLQRIRNGQPVPPTLNVTLSR